MPSILSFSIQSFHSFINLSKVFCHIVVLQSVFFVIVIFFPYVGVIFFPAYFWIIILHFTVNPLAQIEESHGQGGWVASFLKRAPRSHSTTPPSTPIYKAKDPGLSQVRDIYIFLNRLHIFSNVHISIFSTFFKNGIAIDHRTFYIFFFFLECLILAFLLK